MVAMLSSTGMSTRAIAPVVGTTRETVRRDIAAATDTNVSVDEVPAETVTGLNGKTYARPIRIMGPVVAVDASAATDSRRRRHRRRNQLMSARLSSRSPRSTLGSATS